MQLPTESKMSYGAHREQLQPECLKYDVRCHSLCILLSVSKRDLNEITSSVFQSTYSMSESADDAYPSRQ